MSELCEPLQTSLTDEWACSKEKLTICGDNGVDIWIKDLAEKVGKMYFQEFPETPNDQLIQLIPKLSHQVVSEESENGTKVDSEIDVPQYLRKLVISC